MGWLCEDGITPQDKTVSRQHREILENAGRYFVTGVESKKGTSLGGEMLYRETEPEVKKPLRT